MGHPAGSESSAFMASRRRMLNVGTVVIAVSQCLIGLWGWMTLSGAARTQVVAGSVLGLAVSFAYGALRSQGQGTALVTAWMLALVPAIALQAWGTRNLGALEALAALPAATVAGVVLPPRRFLVVAVATASVLVAPVAAEQDASQTFVSVGIYSVFCLLVASVASEQRRLLRARSGQTLQARARAREVDHLLRVARTVSQAYDENRVANEILELVCTFVGARGGAIARWDPEERCLEPLRPGWGTADPRDAATPDAGDVLLTAVPQRQPDRILMPLHLDGRPLGMLLAVGPTRGDTFTQEDEDRIEALAGQAAVVLDHAHRYTAEREANARLLELARLKSDFVATVSHELRTPITTVLGVLKTLLRPELVHPEERARRLLASAHRQAERLHQLIEDLLTVGRIEAGAVVVRPELIDPEALATEVLEEVVTPSPLHHGRVVAPPGLAQLVCDRENLRRVLLNLVDNAVKYSPHGEVSVEVSSTANRMRIVVSDAGPGIPPGEQGALFQRFSRLHPGGTRGTGLGLYIVANMVAAMGGWVGCCSDVGFGTRFGVILPLDRPPAAPDPPPLPVVTRRERR